MSNVIRLSQLTANFTMQEMIKSQTATRYGVDNTPNLAQQYALQAVAKHILQPVRDHMKRSFSPSSGFRGDKLNALIRGSSKSQHRYGEAADFEVPGWSNYALAEWIKLNLTFDQLILEFYVRGKPSSGWVHCSYVEPQTKGRANRMQVLTAVKSNGKTVYLPGLRF